MAVSSCGRAFCVNPDSALWVNARPFTLHPGASSLTRSFALLNLRTLLKTMNLTAWFVWRGREHGPMGFLPVVELSRYAAK